MAEDNVQGKIGEQPNAPAARSFMWRRSLLIRVVLCICGVVLVTWVVNILRRPSASVLFRWYVVEPIPASVAHIEVDQPMTHGGYGYVFRFAVNQADFELILKSRPFRRAYSAMRRDGHVLTLRWWKDLKDSTVTKSEGGEVHTFPEVDGVSAHNFPVYDRTRRQPSWYNLATWHDPDTYAWIQTDRDDLDDKQVLIYNSRLGQAYFIVFDYRGTTGFTSFGRKGGMYDWNEDKTRRESGRTTEPALRIAIRGRWQKRFRITGDLCFGKFRKFRTATLFG